MKSFFKVFVYLVLLPPTWPESPSDCKFEYKSISSYFSEILSNVTNFLLDDYEVEVLSNLEKDNHCSELWWNYDVYMMLNALEKKAGKELRIRIITLLQQFAILNDCRFTKSKTCTKHRRPLVQVLQGLDYQKMENITGDYSNCTFIRCFSGNTIALTDQPVDHHDNVTANYSNEGQDAGIVPNYGNFSQQKKREPSNKTALGQDKMPQREGIMHILLLFPVSVFVVGLVLTIRKSRLHGSSAEDQNMRDDPGGTNEGQHESESTDPV